jgi:hypothetical protein
LDRAQPDVPLSNEPLGARKYWLLSPNLEKGEVRVRVAQEAACAAGETNAAATTATASTVSKLECRTDVGRNLSIELLPPN